ncbi:hypothetical protein M9H77_01552 [Catharanthus roseus]|uniref:Uncharacterized protein n=1 Tax=Catharanthus roseus TaxID=4058 RepID=A0ACC0C607_CATRO|nr:hypothetical protein M9H77_01552 [Catharanthus roseus]
MLLSITPLAIVNIIEEEENFLVGETDFTSPRKEKQLVGSRRQDLVVSLQKLTDYEGLLTPPLSVSSSANQAAARAMLFLSGLSVGSGYFDGISLNDMPSGFSGNLQHLIVEACITRNILDNSAYLWPGYVKGHTNQVPRGLSGQMSGWSSFVKGSPLTPPMVNVLVSTPASSLAEIEKIYDIAVNGPDDDKISAATILCGASLNRGWNIQEHALLFITRLMCPPVPANYSGTDSHLIGYAPFINVLLVGLSSYDCVQIFSLHGLVGQTSLAHGFADDLKIVEDFTNGSSAPYQVPQLAGALMPICEAFGSCAPNISWTLATGEEISTYAVFSNAFTLLLRLWRFDQSPFEHVCGEAAPVGSHVSPEYLLLHQACIASTLSGLVPGTPIHQIVDALLAMMFRRINRGAQPIIPATSGSSNSSGTGLDDFHIHLKLPAWDILEAVPFVLDAVLTACGHGTLSPRELATGLKDLADFLPASLATIVSYFSAEVTRGLWKSAFMNGSDWPSPAANLAYVENQIKKILADTGVEVPRFPVGVNTGGNSPATLPLPLAALVSVTITYKLDSETDRYLNLVGPSLTNLATSCPWPCMAIVFALWAQKAKRWSDFLIFCVSRAVFHHNSDAVVQLLKVCFATTLGLNSSSSGNGGVGSLLGHGFGSHTSGGFRPIAPGVLFLRVHHAVRKIVFITEEIVSLLLESVKCIASSGLPSCNLEKLKKTKHGTKYGQVSLAAALTRVKVAASLGASIVWITGGSNLVQSLIKETLPSWFISVQRSSESNGGDLGGGMVDMLGGYALAYFAVLSGTFAWGLDSTSSATKRRAQILGQHLEFLADALDGKFSLGCNKATWRAYVSGFLGLMVVGTPIWIREVNVEVLKRLSKALKQWNEVELALALLEIGGVPAMGAAAEMIIETGI